MHTELKSLTDAGVTVVAISYDSVDVLKAFAEKHKIAFALLSDPDHKAIDAFELRNKEAKGKQEGIPYPGTMILDKDGVIRAKLFFDGPIKRHAAEDIVKAAGDIK